MGRPKSRAGSKPVQDSVTVATDTTPSPPTTRKKAAAEAAVAETPKKTAKARGKADATPATTTREAKKTAAKTKKELDKSLRKARKAVDDIADSLDASSDYPLPGIFSPAVENKVELLRDIVALAVVSSLLSSGTRLAVEWFAASYSQTWMSGVKFFGTAGPQDIIPFASSVLARTVRLSLSWGSSGSLSALQALSSMPIIYLLNSFYQIPISAAFFAEILNISIETYVLEGYHFLKGTDDDETDFDKERDDFFDLMKRDIVTVVYPYAFAAVIYVFVFVQACRFYLPGTLVVHFEGIRTVEPARVPSLLVASLPSVSDLFANIFLSFPAVVISTICGLFCRNYIFGFTKDAPRKDNTSSSRNATIRRHAIDARVLAAGISVFASIYTQCLYEIPGVDNVGAAAYAATWAVCPLFVSMGLIFTGI